MKCPVCDNNTFDDADFEYNICPECFWEWDMIQVEEPDYAGGANRHCLRDYRKKYWEFKNENPNFSCKNEEDKEKMLQFERQR
ncbi:MAG: CPCC family cysteine-rich protein [Eubacteriales bacterium]|nr:CPCC family cysteine-rich protein [Eubacteriales bacterium]